MERARCAGQDPELFMPSSDGPHEDPVEARLLSGPTLNRALNFCAACPLPVAARCLLESLEQGTHYGIRGGLLASERRLLRTSWSSRLRDEAVSATLQGAVMALSPAERREVVRRFAVDQAHDDSVVARGLGIPRSSLVRLAWLARKADRASSSPPDADAA
ncbi:WhiB family transcriptional regulator [Streptomyces sp. NPDC056773]|uniref:WhiB family transcriptional regulator n=1 Tax=unclassified Streptomyces TaxID=2593676 RepID=UPI0036845E9F